MQFIKNATLVVADNLVSPAILGLVECRLIRCESKHGDSDKQQNKINTAVIEAALAREHVVRLKIGDPMLYGRGGEEILEYRKHGIETVVVPGLSSALTAPALAFVPVTHRGVADQVVICTGCGSNGRSPDLPDFHPSRTVVLLMAVGRLAVITAALMSEKKYPPSTLVTIVESASLPSQRVLRGCLKDIANLAARAHVVAPAAIVIGEVNGVLAE
jgi:uroporphyrin-III C-methyltransferase